MSCSRLAIDLWALCCLNRGSADPRAPIPGRVIFVRTRRAASTVAASSRPANPAADCPDPAPDERPPRCDLTAFRRRCAPAADRLALEFPLDFGMTSLLGTPHKPQHFQRDRYASADRSISVRIGARRDSVPTSVGVPADDRRPRHARFGRLPNTGRIDLEPDGRFDHGSKHRLQPITDIRRLIRSFRFGQIALRNVEVANRAKPATAHSGLDFCSSTG